MLNCVICRDNVVSVSSANVATELPDDAICRDAGPSATPTINDSHVFEVETKRRDTGRSRDGNRTGAKRCEDEAPSALHK